MEVRSSEGLGVIAGRDPRIVPMKLAALCGMVGCGAGKGRKDTGAQCPRVRLVLGDVIDIGERRALVLAKVAEA